MFANFGVGEEFSCYSEVLSLTLKVQLLQDWNETLFLKEVSSFLNKKLSYFFQKLMKES